MSTAITETNGSVPAELLERTLITGDIARLSPPERLAYYQAVCESLKLNPLTRPFDYLTLNGKTILYAKRDATDQLRQVHRVSVRIVARERLDDVYVVTASATLPDGRTDESIGAVSIAGLKGEALANAFMKCETKSKRRVTLSICGLGMLDETETEAIPGAQRVDFDAPKHLPSPSDATPKVALATPKVAPTAVVTRPTKVVDAMTHQQFLDRCADDLGLSLKDLKQLFPMTVNGFMRDGGYTLEDVYRLLEARTHDGTLLPHEQPSAAVQALLDDEPPPPNEADLVHLAEDLARAEAAGAAAEVER